MNTISLIRVILLTIHFLGGATRVALTQHHALRGNLADVTSKDSSQETCVNLLASFLGIYLLNFIQNSGYDLSNIYYHLRKITFLCHLYL